jgi:UDP-glucose 4-epimerase
MIMAMSPVSTALVTGGCGFVGRHLVRHLVRLGYSVWIIDDLSTGKHPDVWLGSEWERRQTRGRTINYTGGGRQVWFTHADIVPLLYELTAVEPFLEEQRLTRIGDVFHLASVVGGRAKIEGDPIAVAIDLAIDAALFRWLVQNRQHVDRILFASSSAAYPIHLQSDREAVALKEDYISFDEGLGQPDMTYGWSKLTGEYIARIAASHYGLHTVCVRPFSGYGGDQDSSYPVPAIARRVAAGENPLIVWGTGQQGRDFIHVDDCLEAMLRALDRISDGSGVNIGSGRLTTFMELAKLLSSLAGYSPEIRPLLDKPMGVHSRYADTTRMQSVLNWQPKISLQEGMRRVLEDQRDQLAKQALAER